MTIKDKIRLFKAEKEGLLKGAIDIDPVGHWADKEALSKRLFRGFKEEMEKTIKFCDQLLKEIK